MDKLEENPIPSHLGQTLIGAVLSVPIRIKIAGMIALPVMILGTALNYWVRTGLSDWLSRILEEERVMIALEHGSRSVMLVTTIATGFSMLLTSLLLLMLTKPLIELSNVAKDVAAGKTDSRARIWSHDEIGEMANSVNGMIDQLVANQQTLENVNLRLEAINQVAVAVGGKLTLQDVLDTALHTTLEVMGLEKGWIFLRIPNRNSFRLATSNSLHPDFENTLLSEPKICPCQRQLLNTETHNAPSVHVCERFETTPTDENNPALGHITILLQTSEKQLGVLNLMCPTNRQLTADDLEMLTIIGAQISESVHNAWLHADLLEKEKSRQLLLEALVRAQEDERAKLARRLHDDTGQTLTSLLIRLKALQNRSPSPEFSEEVEKLYGSISETIEKVQGIAYQLRPADLEEFGIEVALRTLAREMLEVSGILATQTIDLPNRKLPFEIETSLYRIAQESMVNIVRHSEAHNVHITLSATPQQVEMRIKDDGIGLDPETSPQVSDYSNLGLRSMRERAEMVGGSWQMVSQPGQGTTIIVRLPLILEMEKLT